MHQTPHSLLLTVLAIWFSLLTACNGNQEKSDVLLWKMHRLLELSTQQLTLHAQQELHALAEKQEDPATMFRAEEWYSKLEFFMLRTNAIYNVIDSLQNELLKLAKQEKPDLAFFKSVKTDRKYASMVASAERKLANLLSELKDDIFAKSSQIEKDLKSSELWSSIFTFPILAVGEKEQYSAAAIFASLSLIKNKIRMLSSTLAVYCNLKVGSYDDYFYSYSAIIGQNASVVRPGEKLEINAGVGAFSTDSKPEILVYNKKQPLLAEGFARFTGIAPQKAGKYTIPVTIIFNAFADKRDTVERTVTYEVVDY